MNKGNVFTTGFYLLETLFKNEMFYNCLYLLETLFKKEMFLQLSLSSGDLTKKKEMFLKLFYLLET